MTPEEKLRYDIVFDCIGVIEGIQKNREDFISEIRSRLDAFLAEERSKMSAVLSNMELSIPDNYYDDTVAEPVAIDDLPDETPEEPKAGPQQHTSQATNGATVSIPQKPEPKAPKKIDHKFLMDYENDIPEGLRRDWSTILDFVEATLLLSPKAIAGGELYAVANDRGFKISSVFTFKQKLKESRRFYPFPRLGWMINPEFRSKN